MDTRGDLLNSADADERIGAARALGARVPHKGSFSHLLDRMDVEEDPRVLEELRLALMRHFAVSTADRLLGRAWRVREQGAAHRSAAARALLADLRTALSYSEAELEAEGARLAEKYAPAASPASAPPAVEIASSPGVVDDSSAPTIGSAALAGFPADPIPRAREMLEAGARVQAVALLQEAVRRGEHAALASAWLGAVLGASGQASLAAEYLQRLAHAAEQPLVTEMDRVRAYCRAQGLTPLPPELRERRAAGSPWEGGSSASGRAVDPVTQARLALPGRFEQVEHIGTGGMGIVFRARDLDLAADVAIKMLSPDHWRDERAVRRFTLEARAMARLSHPAVLRVISIERGEVPFFTMELLEGQTLDCAFPPGEAPAPGVVLRTLVPVLEALDHCHEAGLVHRDVKPRNIFVTRSGEVRLMDFGVVKASGQSSVTAVGTIVGTPHYMSPEQLVGTKIDRRVDIYSFGVTLFQMLTGVLPFQDPGEVFNRPTPSVADWVPVPAELDAVIGRCLKRSPADRYATARELLAALEPFVARDARESAEPSARDVFSAVLVECLEHGAMGERELELLAGVRRLLGIPAEVHQQIFREIQSRVRGERPEAKAPLRLPPETLYRLVFRRHRKSEPRDPDSERLLDDVGRLLEIPRPRRRELERELAGQ